MIAFVVHINNGIPIFCVFFVWQEPQRLYLNRPIRERHSLSHVLHPCRLNTTFQISADRFAQRIYSKLDF